MINWENVEYFDPNVDKFPEGELNLACPELIYQLNTFRKVLGRPIYPSPVKGALARQSGSENSRHYAVNRLSDAIDVFCTGDPFHTWITAITSKLWGGIGIYPFTRFQGREWVMFHLDMRPGMTLWVRDRDGAYYYPQRIEHIKKFKELIC